MQLEVYRMKSLQYKWLCGMALVCFAWVLFSSGPAVADNAYRYFYLYKNSEFYKQYHPEEEKEDRGKDDKKDEFRLNEDERDYYLEGDDEDYEEDDEQDDNGHDTPNEPEKSRFSD